MNKKMKSLGFGAALLAISSVLSRVMGLLRDMTIAFVFGTGHSEGIYALDAYFAAFRIPDLIYTFLIAGAMSAAFVPIYTQLKQQSQDRASVFGSQALHFLLVVLLIACTGMWIFAPVFVPWITPGFTVSLQALAVDLTRIMLLSPLFLGLSSIFQGIENSHKSFWGIALAPLVYNASLILGAYFFGEKYGVHALSWSVVIGAIFHFLVQWPGIFHTRFKYHWNWNFRSSELKEFFTLSLPRLFGMAFTQMNALTDTMLASLLAVGSLSVYHYSLNLQSLPYGVVAISVSVAIFASLSELNDDLTGFKKTLKSALNTILFWVLPAVVGLFMIRNELVDTLLMRGEFDSGASERTSLMLGIFVWAALGQSIIPLFARAFYALKDTKTPVISTLIAGSVQILLSVLFVIFLEWPVWSLAISAIVGSSLNAIYLIMMMSRRLNSNCFALFDHRLGWTIIHVSIMAMGIFGIQQIHLESPIMKLYLSVLVAGILYLGLHRITRTSPGAL